MSYRVNIEKKTKNNNFYRKVLFTVPNQLQLVIMSIKPGKDIGMEVHHHNSQFIRVEQGKAKVIVGDKTYFLRDDDIVIIGNGERHNVINTSKDEDLKIYTIYAPPEHPDGLVQRNQ